MAKKGAITPAENQVVATVLKYSDKALSWPVENLLINLNDKRNQNACQEKQKKLPSEMSKGFVGVGHFVGINPLFDRSALIL